MWRRVPNQLRETLIRCRSDPTVTSSPIPRNPTSSQSAMKPSCLFSHQFSSDTIVAKKVMPIAIGHEREPAAQQTQIGFRTGSSTSHSLSFYKTPGQELFKMGMVKPSLLTRCITTANTEAPLSQNTIPDVPTPRIKFKRLDKQARHIMQTWLEKWPEKAAFMRLAGEGSWFHQFRAVVLLRISPFSFIIYNYAVVATNVKYCPYILGLVVGVIPEIFVAIYSGILIRQLADASQSHQYLSPIQIIYNGLGFITTVATIVAITIYAKKALKKLKNEEEQLLE